MKLKLSQGEIVGKENKSIPNSKIYHSFEGIPYAEPPVNHLRFKAPVPHKGWNGVLNATEPGSPCLQKILYISPTPFGSEDCLYVNVHVPESTDDKPKPVLVFVHGGGFLSGSGNFYKPDYLMEYDVIVVTFNYRINVFGFLNLGLPECPGNVGLKDQVLLFKWIRDNIEVFGGDPQNITAVGESAGGASIHYLMISPLGKGLFDRAIIQSGSALCPWAFTEKQTENAFRLGSFLGIETTDKQELINCLLTVPAEDLLTAAGRTSSEIFKKNYFFESSFVPSIEYGHDRSAALIPDYPDVLVKNAIPIPTLTGINDLECLILLMAEAPKKKYLILSRCDDERILPREVRPKIKDKVGVLKKIKSFYSLECAPEKGVLGVLNLLTDVFFEYPFHKQCQSVLKRHPNVPVYNYKFSYDGSLNIFKKAAAMLLGDINVKGASHVDELFYLFIVKTGFPIPSYEQELPMINNMCTLWTNFVKYGTPSPPESSIEWKPTSAENPCYLHIDDTIQMKSGVIDAERVAFWDNITNEIQLSNSLLQLRL